MTTSDDFQPAYHINLTQPGPERQPHLARILHGHPGTSYYTMHARRCLSSVAGRKLMKRLTEFIIGENIYSFFSSGKNSPKTQEHWAKDFLALKNNTSNTFINKINRIFPFQFGNWNPKFWETAGIC